MPGATHESDAPPALSVLLPTFRRGASGLFWRAATSILDQTFRDLELIIIDDASTDGTADQITRLMAMDGRVSCIRHLRNVGLPAISEYEAYCKTRGTHIAFAFDDFIFEPDALGALYTESVEHDAPVVQGWAQLAMPSERPGDAPLMYELGRDYDDIHDLMLTNFIPNSAVMVHRRVLEEVGLYDPHIFLVRVCDWDLWRRVIRRFPWRRSEVFVGIEYGLATKDSLGNTQRLERMSVNEWMNAERDAALRPAALANYDVLMPRPDNSPYTRDQLVQQAATFSAKFWFPPDASDRILAVPTRPGDFAFIFTEHIDETARTALQALLHDDRPIDPRTVLFNLKFFGSEFYHMFIHARLIVTTYAHHALLSDLLTAMNVPVWYYTPSLAALPPTLPAGIAGILVGNAGIDKTGGAGVLRVPVYALLGDQPLDMRQHRWTALVETMPPITEEVRIRRLHALAEEFRAWHGVALAQADSLRKTSTYWEQAYQSAAPYIDYHRTALNDADTLRGQITGLNEHITGLNDQITGLNDHIVQLTDNLDATERANTDLFGQIAAIQAARDGRLAEAHTQIAQLAAESGRSAADVRVARWQAAQYARDLHLLDRAAGRPYRAVRKLARAVRRMVRPPGADAWNLISPAFTPLRDDTALFIGHDARWKLTPSDDISPPGYLLMYRLALPVTLPPVRGITLAIVYEAAHLDGSIGLEIVIDGRIVVHTTRALAGLDFGQPVELTFDPVPLAGAQVELRVFADNVSGALRVFELHRSAFGRLKRRPFLGVLLAE